MINCYENDNGQVNHINKTLIDLDVGLETNIHNAACLCKTIFSLKSFATLRLS